MVPKRDTSTSNGKTASILKNRRVGRNSKINPHTQEMEGSSSKKSGRFKKNNISSKMISSSNIFGESQPATGFLDSENIIDASNNYKFENLSHFGMLNN